MALLEYYFKLIREIGLKNRAIGHHNMNEHSSRSHTILTVHIHSEEKATGDNKGVYITRHGKINFVDLAGSEMTKKTRSEGKTLGTIPRSVSLSTVGPKVPQGQGQEILSTRSRKADREYRFHRYRQFHQYL